MLKIKCIMRAEVIKVTRKKILKSIEKQEIKPIQAYRYLYSKPTFDRATFCKIKMNLNNESRGVNRLMKLIFLFPMPIFLIQFGIGFMKNKIEDIDITELKKLIVYMKGTSIEVQDANKEVNINIKIY